MKVRDRLSFHGLKLKMYFEKVYSMVYSCDVGSMEQEEDVTLRR